MHTHGDDAFLCIRDAVRFAWFRRSLALVENIILMLTPPSAYYPSEDTLLELGLTHGCTEAIECRNVLQAYQGEHEWGSGRTHGVWFIGILQKQSETCQAVDHVAKWRLPGHRGSEHVPCVHRESKGSCFEDAGPYVRCEVFNFHRIYTSSLSGGQTRRWWTRRCAILFWSSIKRVH